MKKCLSLAALLFFVAGVAHGVDTSQIKLKVDGGLSGDAAKALAVTIYRGTSAPGSPIAGQLWLDTNYTPAILKAWNGSAWAAPQSNAAVQTRADVTSFPGSPVDGQMFYSKSPRGLYVYDGTLGQWVTFYMPLVITGPNLIDSYSAAVMTPPAGAMVATISATAGTTGAGAYSWKVTCRNANGGETTVGSTSSNTVTPGVVKSADLASVPVCSTATGPTPTNRNVYRTKTAQAGTGPWYFVGNIADNTTTTYHDGATDGVGLAPDVNFSAALPSGWSVLNVGTSGGCGGTGASRLSLACYNGANATLGAASQSADTGLRASLSIASYTSGNFTIQYRVKQLSQNGDSFLTVNDPTIFGVRNGTADNAQRLTLGLGITVVLPFSASNHGGFYTSERTTAAGVSTNITVRSNPYPQIDALPLWVRWVKRGVTANLYVSSDGANWVASYACSGTTNNTSALCSFTPSVFGVSSMDHVEVLTGVSTSTAAAGLGPFVEIDSFTLTVN